MTREEAIKLIDTHTVCFYNEIDSPTLQALHLAIEALSEGNIARGIATILENEQDMRVMLQNADRPEVVRCKDCIHWDTDSHCDTYRRAEDFCSWGERREECT